jgi:5-methylcytosine-specific restriction endonuclease McrA
VSQTTESHEEWEHRKNIPVKVAAAVLERDHNQCQICGTGGENRLQLHHWRSFRSQGGPHTQDNLVTLCFVCHELVHRGLVDVVVLEVTPGVWQAFSSH